MAFVRLDFVSAACSFSYASDTERQTEIPLMKILKCHKKGLLVEDSPTLPKLPPLTFLISFKYILQAIEAPQHLHLPTFDLIVFLKKEMSKVQVHLVLTFKTLKSFTMAHTPLR